MLLFALAMQINSCNENCSNEVIIQRNTANTEEEEILSIAENYCPPVDEITEFWRNEIGFTGEMPEAGCVWWYDQYMRLPYAITGDAVNYYAQLTRDQGCTCSWGCFGKQCTHNWTHYTADITFVEEYSQDEAQFQKVFVVQITLDWGSQDAPLAGNGFSKERTVIISENRVVLAVYGDGETNMWVS